MLEVRFQSPVLSQTPTYTPNLTDNNVLPKYVLENLEYRENRNTVLNSDDIYNQIKAPTL